MEKLLQEIISNLDKEYSGHRGWLKKKYDYLGGGSGRDVYALGKDMVLKVSHNISGDMQGDIETRIFQEPQQYLDYLCPILISDTESYNFVVMPKAQPITDLLNRTPHPFYTIANAFEDIAKIIKPTNIASATELISIIKGMENDFGLVIGDLESIDSWGILGDKLVLFDYGCTFEVFLALKDADHEEL